jgi:hypothetical protein
MEHGGNMRKTKKKKATQAAQETARADFDQRWGVGRSEGDEGDEVVVIDGHECIKCRPIPVLVDITKDWRDEDGRVNENIGIASNIALNWLFEQPEQRILGVPELFKEKLAQHRTGIKGGLGSEHHEFAKAAVARVLATLTPEEIETAKAATQRMADRLVATFPSASINEPPDPAATPEEVVDFYRKNESQYTHIN